MAGWSGMEVLTSRRECGGWWCVCVVLCVAVPPVLSFNDW